MRHFCAYCMRSRASSTLTPNKYNRHLALTVELQVDHPRNWSISGSGLTGSQWLASQTLPQRAGRVYAVRRGHRWNAAIGHDNVLLIAASLCEGTCGRLVILYPRQPRAEGKGEARTTAVDAQLAAVAVAHWHRYPKCWGLLGDYAWCGGEAISPSLVARSGSSQSRGIGMMMVAGVATAAAVGSEAATAARRR